MLDFLVQHVIANIPTFVWIFVAGGGAGAYVLLGFLDRLPVIGSYATVIRVISVVAFGIGMFMWGGSGISQLWQAQIQQKQQEIDIANAKSNDANVKIKYVIKEKLKVIHDRQVIVKHDIQRDAAAIDAGCKVAPQAIKDLNEAAK